MSTAGASHPLRPFRPGFQWLAVLLWLYPSVGSAARLLSIPEGESADLWAHDLARAERELGPTEGDIRIEAGPVGWVLTLSRQGSPEARVGVEAPGSDGDRWNLAVLAMSLLQPAGRRTPDQAPSARVLAATPKLVRDVTPGKRVEVVVAGPRASVSIGEGPATVTGMDSPGSESVDKAFAPAELAAEPAAEPASTPASSAPAAEQPAETAAPIPVEGQTPSRSTVVPAPSRRAGPTGFLSVGGGIAWARGLRVGALGELSGGFVLARVVRFGFGLQLRQWELAPRLEAPAAPGIALTPFLEGGVVGPWVVAPRLSAGIGITVDGRRPSPQGPQLRPAHLHGRLTLGLAVRPAPGMALEPFVSLALERRPVGEPGAVGLSGGLTLTLVPPKGNGR